MKVLIINSSVKNCRFTEGSLTPIATTNGYINNTSGTITAHDNFLTYTFDVRNFNDFLVSGSTGHGGSSALCSFLDDTDTNKGIFYPTSVDANKDKDFSNVQISKPSGATKMLVQVSFAQSGASATPSAIARAME